MKKAIIIICLTVVIVFCGVLLVYGAVQDATVNTVTIASEMKTGDIGSFSALTPSNGATVTSIPAFTWTEAENADTYTLEIASDETFDIADEYYIVTAGITGAKYNLKAELKKDRVYYWRVTAKNGNNSRVIDGEYMTFAYQATLAQEVRISLGYADEWKVHEVGSKATVSLDHSGFFSDRSDEKDALRVSFDSEDTQRGEAFVESNGWIVLTRSLETEFYGLDAFYFNFYYSGNDATAFFRVIDEDNEYWYAPIKLASGARQTIIIPLEDFMLRTKGTPVMNERFDYQYLKSMELVFERVDGDGVAYFGDLRAIRLENFGDMFVDNFDFREFKSSISSESAYFTFTDTVSDSGNALTSSFTKDDGVDASLKGFGFLKMQVNKILKTGDAFSFHIDLSEMGSKNFNYLLRMIEEDDDVWVFKIAASEIPEDGNLLVPFSAFLLAEGGFKGDGIRQFYLIKQIQFGMSACYQQGAITIEDLKVVSLSEEVNDLYKTTVSDSGLIEGFEDYEKSVDVYYKWAASTANKDEAISLYTDTSLGANNHAAMFYYKTDLPDAEYRINFVDKVSGYTAIQIHAKDVPIGGKATMIVYLHGGPNELYYYEVKNLSADWTSYTIPISSFKLTEDSFGSSLISCENISGITIAFKSTYTIWLVPQYASGGYVCVDNIAFTNAASYQKKEVSGKIKQSTTNSNIAMISDFDSDETFVYWAVKQGAVEASSFAPNSAIEIVNESASGSGRSLRLSYKSKMTAPYYTDIVVDSSVKAKGLTLLIKGDAKNAYAEIILYVNSTAYLATIHIEEGWNYYSIGFSNFISKDDGTTPFNQSDRAKINQVAIFIKNNNGDYVPGTIDLDEIYFSNSIALITKSVSPYAA